MEPYAESVIAKITEGPITLLSTKSRNLVKRIIYEGMHDTPNEFFEAMKTPSLYAFALLLTWSKETNKICREEFVKIVVDMVMLAPSCGYYRDEIFAKHEDGQN